MKAILKSTAITAIITLLFSFNTMANVNFNEEAYIDDIPFNTETIYSKVVIERNLLDFEQNEEVYINDIPFSTEAIAEIKLYDLTVTEEFTFDEEAYVDDIPFSTEEVCENMDPTPESSNLTCDYSETSTSNMREDTVELKYFEQNSHILMRY